MPETIAEAYIQIKPSMEGVSGELEQALGGAADSSAKSFGSKFSSTLSTLGKVGAAAVGAATAATGALVGNLVSATSSVAEYGDNIDKMSQKMGISAEAYQEWEAVMQHSGTSMETLKASMKTMSTAVESGNEAFERLGITEEEIANLSQEDIFSRVIEGLQDMGEGTERTYLAGQLLGRGATELGALLNTSAEETEAMKQRVHELGGVMSDEAVKSAAGFQDSLQDMKTAMSGITRSLATDFLPTMTSIMDGVANLLSGDKDLGLEQIQKGIDDFIKGITEKLPEIMEVGFDIIKTIADSLLDNLPLIIQTGLDILLALANGIIEHLPEIIPAVVDVILQIVETLTDPDNLIKLIDGAVQLIIALAEGLINALPKLLEKAPIIIANLVIAIVKAVPKLFDAAAQIITTLVTGIGNLLGKILEIGGKLVTTIKDGFMEKVNAAKDWGKDLIDNFIGGIKQKWEDLKATISNVANTVKDFLGFSEPDEGPLSNFHTFAPDMIDLFAQGITGNIGTIKDAMGTLASTVKGEMPSGDVVVNSTMNRTLATSEAGSSQLAIAGGMGSITIPVYIGQKKVEQIVVDALQVSNYKSGGR